jgi:hypothetical protein
VGRTVDCRHTVNVTVFILFPTTVGEKPLDAATPRS